MATCKKFCVPAVNITLRQRLRQLIGKHVGEFGVGIKVKNGNSFQGIIQRVGTTFLTFRTNNNKRVIIRISNIVDIDLGEVGADDALKIGNRLAIVRPKKGFKTAIFVRVGKDFVEFIRIDPQDEQEVTFYFREIVPCSQMRSIECIFNKCTKTVKSQLNVNANQANNQRKGNIQCHQ